MHAARCVHERLNPVTTGLSLTITEGAIDLLLLVVAFAPGAFLAAFGLVAHDLNLAPMTQMVAPMSLVGLLALMAYSFIAGLLFGLVNKLVT